MTLKDFKKELNKSIPWYIHIWGFYDELWCRFKVLIGKCDHPAGFGESGSKTYFCLYCKKVVKD